MLEKGCGKCSSMVLHPAKEQELECYLWHQRMSTLFFSLIDYNVTLITPIMSEYESLVLGLEATRKLKIEHMIVYGDAELIVKIIKNQYQAKHPRLRSYRNCAWDLIENFLSSFNIRSIPEMQNQQVDSLAKDVATFILPTVLKLKYHNEMRHRPLIPNNVQNWKVFEYDEQSNNS
jgi:hypothetical protein